MKKPSFNLKFITNSTWKKALIIIVVLLTSFFLIYKNTIFQEGNPLPVLSGILKLNFTSENIVPIAENNDKYITKNSNGRDSLVSLMAEKGYEFLDQMGSGYFFKKEGQPNVAIMHRYYSTYYDIWDVAD